MLRMQPFILLSRQCVVKSVMRKEGGLGDVEKGIIKKMKGNLLDCMDCFQGLHSSGYVRDLRIFSAVCPAAESGEGMMGQLQPKRWETPFLPLSSHVWLMSRTR